MPYSAGFHPYFLTPQKQDYHIHFTATQRYQYNRQLTEVTPDPQPLQVPQPLCAPQINEQLNQIQPHSTIEIRHHQKGHIIMHSESEQFNHLQLYTDPTLPFFCAEPWMSPPNALNHPEYCQWLQPSESKQTHLSFQWHR